MTAPRATSEALNSPVMSAERRALRLTLAELGRAAGHFDDIARKAEHWLAVFAGSETSEARWVPIRNQARHRANECRRAIDAAAALVPDAGEPQEMSADSINHRRK